MDFGFVPANELQHIDFRLPADPAFNKRVLNNQRKADAKVYAGNTSWGRPEWVGKWYPDKTKDKDFLQHYVKQFNSIELNSTYYKIYDTGTIEKWAAKAGSDFKFCPKMFQGVTHKNALTDKQPLTTEFLEGIRAFGKALGPIFIQLSDYFSPNRMQELFQYLEQLPSDISFFLELRHSEWFSNKNIFEKLLAHLQLLNIGLVITDTAGRRDCAHMHLTIPKAFIRFVGNNMHAVDYKRMESWAQRINSWLQNGLEECYFFIHLHNESLIPNAAIHAIDAFNAACGLQLKKPMMLPKATLF